MDLTKVKEALSSMLTEKTSTEDAEKIGKALGELENAEKQMKDLLSSAEQTRIKYVELVKKTSSGDQPQPHIKDDAPKSFDDYLKGVKKK